MKLKKALVALVCAIALVTATFLGTMAYFTSQDSVTNTFTVGKVDIMLDELDVDKDTEYDTDESDVTPNSNPQRDKNNKYHLIPAVENTKDPTVTVIKGSEDSYVRMLVTVNDINKLETALEDDIFKSAEDYGNYGKIFLIQMLTGDATGNMTWNETNWSFAGYSENTTGEGESAVTSATYEFRYTDPTKNEKNDVVAKNEDANTVLPALFTKITVPGAYADNTDMEQLLGVTIEVEAHAIQAAGFADANAAWAAWN